MAKEYQGEEPWLPSGFLCDAFFLEGGPKNGGETVDDVAGLAHRMAPYFLPSAREDAPVAAPEHAKAMARSPQSTLCAWSTSNGHSLVSSPPSSSPLAQRSKDDPCDLLCEAADQVMRLRRLGDLGRHRTVYDRGVLGPPRQPLPATYAISRNIDDASTPVFTLQQLQAARVSLMLFTPSSPGLVSALVSWSVASVDALSVLLPKASANDEAAVGGGMGEAEQGQTLRWTGRGGPVRVAFGSVALRVAAASRATAAEAATAATGGRNADPVPRQLPRAEGAHRHRRVPSPVRLQRPRPEENHRSSDCAGSCKEGSSFEPEPRGGVGRTAGLPWSPCARSRCSHRSKQRGAIAADQEAPPQSPADRRCSSSRGPRGWTPPGVDLLTCLRRTRRFAAALSTARRREGKD